MKRAAVMFAALAVGCAAAGWRGRFDERMSAVLNQGTPIPAVAWYKLDGDALDSSGNGRNGTWEGTEAYTDGPYAAQSGAFGGGSKIDSAAAITTNVTFTATFWIRLNADTISAEYVAFGSSIYAFSFGATTGTSNSMVSRLRIGATPYTTSTGGVLTTGVWYHVAGVIADGQTVATLTISGVTNSSLGAQPLSGFSGVHIGSLRNKPSVDIADVRIFDRALSPANIARIMESQNNEPLEELQ